jgi:hypothetical protein
MSCQLYPEVLINIARTLVGLATGKQAERNEPNEAT